MPRLDSRPRPSPFAYMLAVLAISVGLNCRKFFELRLTDDGTDFETTSMMEFAPYLVRFFDSLCEHEQIKDQQ